jgi:metallo-beta-lactamase class B
VKCPGLIVASGLLFSACAWLVEPSERLRPEDFLPEMNQPIPPAKIVGNIYYVGTNGVSSFLVVTPDGHILIDSGFNQSVPLIRDSVQALGFRFEDIRILLSSHAHFDHVAGHSLTQKLTGAQIIASRADGEVIARGDDRLWAGWHGSPVTRIVDDNDVVQLGGVILKAHLTPGHTEGCTTWTMDATEAGQSYGVVFACGYGINPGVRLVGNSAYPGIVDDYARTFRVLAALKPDVFLAQHPYVFRLEEKLQQARARATPNPFVDPDGYRKAVEAAEAAYLDQLRRERGQSH